MKVVIDGMDDPDVEEGGYLWLQRSDGSNLWQQRLLVSEKTDGEYRLKPVDVMHGY